MHLRVLLHLLMCHLLLLRRVSFLLICWSVCWFTLCISLDSDVVCLIPASLQHLLSACTLDLQTLSQVTCRSYLLMLHDGTLCSSLRRVIVRHVLVLCAGDTWVGLAFCWLSDGSIDVFLGIQMIRLINQALMIQILIDCFRLGDTSIGVSRLLLLDWVLVHPSLLFCRQLGFLDRWTGYLLAHNTLMLGYLCLVVLCWWARDRELLVLSSSCLSLILLHDFLKCLVVKVPTTFMFWALVNVLRTLRACSMGNNQRLLIPRTWRLHLLLVLLLILLVR